MLLLLGLLCFPLGRAEAKGPAPKDVHAAIQRAAAWLQAGNADGFESATKHSTPELVLYTLAHTAVPRDDKVFQAALKEVLACELSYTYRVATQAMALAKLNPYVHRARIAYCAQWLVDSQCADGAWGYPGSVVGRTQSTHALQSKPPVTEEEATGGPKAEPIQITRKVDVKTLTGAEGDFSNTQFALLGLRACREARIEVPAETWETALAYHERFQQPDGSWGYVMKGEQDEAGYASLTAAGAVGVALCLHGMGKKNPKSHPAAKKALAWLQKNWKPEENVGLEDSALIPPSTWQYYHLYAIERVGRVFNLKKIGKRDWYADGAAWILAEQRSDGSWKDPAGDTTAASELPYLHTAATCFAILFLARATPPLTGG
jgi:hypothetical protein